MIQLPKTPNKFLRDLPDPLCRIRLLDLKFLPKRKCWCYFAYDEDHQLLAELPEYVYQRFRDLC